MSDGGPGNSLQSAKWNGKKLFYYKFTVMGIIIYATLTEALQHDKLGETWKHDGRKSVSPPLWGHLDQAAVP